MRDCDKRYVKETKKNLLIFFLSIVLIMLVPVIPGIIEFYSGEQ